MSTNTNTLLNFVEKIHELREQYKDPKQSFNLLKACGDALLKLSPEGRKSLIEEGLAPYREGREVRFDPNGFASLDLSKLLTLENVQFQGIQVALHVFLPLDERGNLGINTTDLSSFHKHGASFASLALDNEPVAHEFMVVQPNKNGTYTGYFKYFDSFTGKAPKSRIEEFGRFNIKNVDKQVSYGSSGRRLCLMSESPVHKTLSPKNITTTLTVATNRTAKPGYESYIPNGQDPEKNLPLHKQIISPEALRQIISRIPIFNS